MKELSGHAYLYVPSNHILDRYILAPLGAGCHYHYYSNLLCHLAPQHKLENLAEANFHYWHCFGDGN